jgi:hypothetical protein
MKRFIILFICFISSLGIVLYNDTSEVREGYNDSIYVFKYVDENNEEVINPETDDIEVKAGIVIIFYSALFFMMFWTKLRMSNKYLVYN